MILGLFVLLLWPVLVLYWLVVEWPRQTGCRVRRKKPGDIGTPWVGHWADGTLGTDKPWVGAKEKR